MTTTVPRRPRIGATRRESDSVMTLELFFDLVFVLALTQATALMANEPTWQGLGKGILVLAVIWWSWVGYAWLTSVIDPEEGAVRLVIAVAMAALMVVALCIPEAFNDSALLFAGAYAVVRIAHIGLFILGSRDEPDLRKSVLGLAVSTAIGVSLLIAASFTDGWWQAGLWVLALTLDALGPYLFGSEGWKIKPRHFAERHGLILIIALGESIVAIGIGVEGLELTTGIVVAAALGVFLSFALWWMYFDIVARVAERRLATAEVGKEQNEIARDSYSYLHFPMVASIVLMALGMKKTLGHVDHHLELVPATALFGGFAVYLLAHVAFRWRNVHRFSTQRLVVAILSVALIPLALEITALASLAILLAVAASLITYETIRFREVRGRLRRELAAH
ncbi:MAG: low temperature requirement protein A [Solirubrobacteraceae bacterium]|nr:low temperature requirement protein A [Solirubrobacteraceae bacterium]